MSHLPGILQFLPQSSFQAHLLEVSLWHTSEHKPFGTYDLTSIQPHARRMPSLLCRFAVLCHLEKRDRVALIRNVNWWPDSRKRAANLLPVTESGDGFQTGWKSTTRPAAGSRKGLALRWMHNIHITTDIKTWPWKYKWQRRKVTLKVGMGELWQYPASIRSRS